MTQTEIVEQLVRRAKCNDAYLAWCDSNLPATLDGNKMNELRAAHGVAPFEAPRAEGLKYGAEIVQQKCGKYLVWHEASKHFWAGDQWINGHKDGGPAIGDFSKSRAAALSALNAAPPPPGWVAPNPAPPPEPAERVRWFKSVDHDRGNQGRWKLTGGKVWYRDIDEEEWLPSHVDAKVIATRSYRFIETDSTGQPLAAPKPEAGEGDVVVEALRLAISREREVIGDPASPFAVDEVLLKKYENAITVARATASLRAEVEAQKQRADANYKLVEKWYTKYDHLVKERSARKPTPRTRKKKASTKKGARK